MRALLIASLAAACFAMGGSDPASAQATRTWISGVGDDVNPCSRTAPCKTFAGAISKTAANGEIDCLDPGGFGAVTITKSITLDCGAFTGGILSGATNGINVNGTNILVVLRNLTITGNFVGLVGVNFISGLSLELHHVNIQGFTAGNASGIRFAPNSAGSMLLVNNTTITGNGISPSTGGGITIVPAAGGSATAIIANSKIENNSVGIAAASTSGAITMTVRDTTIANNRSFGIISAAGNVLNVMVDRSTISNNLDTGVLSSGGNSTIRLYNSVITGNTTGVSAAGGGVLRSYKNNAINGNGADGTPVTQENLN